MRRKTLHACALAVALAWPIALQAQDALPGATVESLLERARSGNPDNLAMLREADSTSERATLAGALPDPRLRAELMDVTRAGTQNPTLLPGRAESVRYTVMQELPWFGKRDLKRGIAELEARGARLRAEDAWQEIAFRIKSTWLQLHFLAANEALNHEILALTGSLEKIAHTRYSAGLASQQDVIRAQLEQTGMRNELIAIEAERQKLQARLNALVGREPMAPLAMPERLRSLPAPVRLDFETLKERAAAKNPQISAEESRLQAAEKNRDLTWKNRYPDFSIGIAPNQARSSVKSWDVMFEVSIPIQQGARRAQEREASSMLDAARARRDGALLQVRSALSENLLALEAARRSESLAADSLRPQAELTMKAALAGYETGKVDFTTLLDAQRQIRQAKLSQLRARTEALARLAEIERIIGEEL